jgi:predicted RND superfamily exporter protein
MKSLMNAIVEYFGNVPDQVRKRKLLVWLAFLAATAFFFVGMGRARLDASIETWFVEDDPLIVALDWFHHDFGSDDHLYIAYKAKDGNVFSEKSLRTLQQLQKELRERVARVKDKDDSALKHIVKITSLINAPVLRVENGALISTKLVGDSKPSTPQELDRVTQIAESQEGFRLLYFSKDHQYGGILIETDFGAIPVDAVPAAEQPAITDLKLDEPVVVTGPAKRPKFKPTDQADYILLMDEVKAVLHKPEYAAHFEYFPVGSPAAAEYDMENFAELGVLNLVALVIIMGLLWFLFRSLSAVVWPVVIVVLTTIWVVGATAWLGFPMSIFVLVAVMLILAVGVADTVHVMSTYMSYRKEGHDHQSAMRKGFRHVAVACLLTTVTNMAAVIALSIAPIVPIQVFALMCALGVGLPFVFSVYLLPLMLDLWAPKISVQTRKAGLMTTLSRLLPDVSAFSQRCLDKILPLVEKGPVTIVVLFMALFGVSLYGATQTKVDTDPVAIYPKGSPMRQSAKVMDEKMAGGQNMEIYLELGVENAFQDPFVLHAMDNLQDTLEKKYGDLVVQTTSLVDTVKDSYRTLNDGRQDMYVIPDNQNAVSQTLFLFNQSNPTDRARLVSDNYDRSHISVRLYNKGSYEYTAAWNSMRRDFDSFLAGVKQKYPDAKVSVTGILPLMMQGADYLTSNELASFGLAIILVSVMLLLLFGSLKTGAIALIPNLIPAMLAYGALGLLGIPLDVTSMMIAPVIIGIAVDDTVHFVTRYRTEIVVDGNIRRALEATIAHAGQSVVFTSLILGLGFGIMALASYPSTSTMGTFGALAIFVGLLCDLFLLPAMILVFKLKSQPAGLSKTAVVQAEPS